MVASETVEIEQARRLILDAVTPLASEPVALHDALGRALAEDVTAPEPVPSFDNSAMDGFAVRARDLDSATRERPTSLRIVGESKAGSPASGGPANGEAVAISTGAMLPDGADAVVRVEDTRVRSGLVEVLVPADSGQDVRRAGEDVAAGSTVLGRHTLLGPAELGVLASLGRAEVSCARRPRVSVLASGDELLGPADGWRPGAIRDSNSLTISALALRAGAEVVGRGVARDDAEATTAAIAGSLENTDVAVICGGVSVGAHDHVRSSLQVLGASTVFWGIALKPGRPAWFGTHGRTLVFGLPGNPVSAMVTFILLVAPALRALVGLPRRARRYTAAITRDYEKPSGRTHAVRCRLSIEDDGWHAEPTGPQGSHILTSMVGAEALAMLPSDAVKVRAGERVEIEPLWMWLGDGG